MGERKKSVSGPLTSVSEEMGLHLVIRDSSNLSRDGLELSRQCLDFVVTSKMDPRLIHATSFRKAAGDSIRKGKVGFKDSKSSSPVTRYAARLERAH